MIYLPRLNSRLFKPNYFLLLLVAVILFTSNITNAATYYLSSSAGNDTYNSIEARNPATPWKSIDRLNKYFKFLAAGDSVLLKRGDVFYGAITVTKSGAVFDPIYLGAYGTGKKPEINGLSTLNKWKLIKSGIYESTCEGNGNALILNGVQQAMGRYPNKGYLSYQSHQGNSSITDDKLSDNINWTGGEVVIRKNRWIIDKSTITSQANGVITYAEPGKDLPTNGFGYFIQKDIKTLDQFGEWYFDAARKKMLVYFGNKNPDDYMVKTDAESNLVNIKRYNNLVFENLSFIGAGHNAFDIVNSSNIKLQHCVIDLIGADAISVSYSPSFAIKNSVINHSLNDAITLDAGCVNSIVVDNEIKNTGLIAGLGKSGSGTYEAITSFGDNTQIERNKIDSTGYDGIYFGGTSSYVKNNYITYFCLTKDDGGGIYIGDWSKTSYKKVINNIVMHGIGNGAGTNRPSALFAEGIYIDDNTESVAITGNTVSLCANNGIKIHNANNIEIYANTVFNNGVQLRLEQDHYLATSSYIRNNSIKNNSFFSMNDLQPNAKFSSQQDDIGSFGQMDNNFYFQPKNDVGVIMASVVKAGKGSNQTYDLSKWKTAYGKDQFSVEMLPGENVRLEYNVSDEVKTVKLDKPYVDVHQHVYKDKVEINPFSSIILVASEQSLAQGK
jgi:parallel beta-helix repeat protein